MAVLDNIGNMSIKYIYNKSNITFLRKNADRLYREMRKVPIDSPAHIRLREQYWKVTAMEIKIRKQMGIEPKRNCKHGLPWGKHKAGCEYKECKLHRDYKLPCTFNDLRHFFL